MKTLIFATILLSSLFANANETHIAIVKNSYNYSKCVKALEQNTSTGVNVFGGNTEARTILVSINPKDMSSVLSFNCIKSVVAIGYANLTLNKVDSRNLTGILKDESAGFYAGLNQGWNAYAAVVRCYDPIGTGDVSDVPYCEFDKVETP